jgi:hypothetical protein
VKFHIDIDKVIKSLEETQESIRLTSNIDYDHINGKIYEAQIETLQAVINAFKVGEM